MGWIHLGLVYHVYFEMGGNRKGFLVTYVNGKYANQDDTLHPSDSKSADGRIVLGGAYSEIDDFYTGMEVDELVLGPMANMNFTVVGHYFLT